jgi:hypothetical protein
VGGLQDLIVPGVNGRTVPVDDAPLLANVLSGYLRDDETASRHGTTAASWARRTLSQQEVYPLYDRVYEGNSVSDDPLRAGWARMRQSRINALAHSAGQLMGTAVERVDDISSGRHLAAHVVFADRGIRFAKHAAEPDWPEGAALPLPKALAPSWTPAEFVLAYQGLPAGAPVPSLAAADAAAGVVITDWHEPLDCPDGSIGAVREISRAFRTCSTPIDDALWHPALESLASAPTRASLNRFDLAVVGLGASGGTQRFRPVHPQVELLRLRRMMRVRCWSLSEAFSARASGVVGVLLGGRRLVVGPPTLCHGDLRAAKLLRGPAGPLACDPERWRYAWGPLDESTYVHHLVRELETMSAATALRTLDALIDTDTDRYLGICWLVVQQLNYAIQDSTRGSSAGVTRATRFFHGLYEALYGRRLTR